MKTPIKNIVSLSAMCCLSFTLVACGGGGSKSSSDRFSDLSRGETSNSSLTTSYYDDELSDEDWAEFFALIGGYSDGLSDYASSDASYGDYLDDDYYYDDYYSDADEDRLAYEMVTNQALSNSMNYYTASIYGKAFAGNAKRFKQSEGFCTSGLADVSNESVAAGSETVIVQFENCVTADGTINGVIQQSMRGDDTATIGDMDIMTSYRNLSIQDGSSRYTMNGDMQQRLEWTSEQASDTTTSSNLVFGISEGGKDMRLEFSNYNTTTAYDLTSNPVVYSISDNYTVNVSSQDYSGGLTLSTVEPVVGYLGGEVISEGRQVLSDGNGQQISLKRKMFKHKK